MGRSRDEDRSAAATALASGTAAYRQAAGLSLTRLAERSGLSVGFLSQIESGLANPTLAAMAQLAAGLGIGLGDLFTPAPRPGADEGGDGPRLRVRRPPVAPPPGTPGRVWELTAPGARHLRASLVQGTPGDHAEPVSHDGEELTVVLRGRFQLRVGEDLWELGEEDLAHYSARPPHALTPLAGESRALVVLTSRATG